MSSFTWLDYSERDRRKMLEVVDLFKERETRDELGLGAVRDSFADQFFPGTKHDHDSGALLQRLFGLFANGGLPPHALISEETLRDLWHIEKKLLKLLHVDSTGSPTWFLDACGRTSHARRRLLLTNHDMGVKLPSRALQLGLNFAADLPELFAGKEMGEDALRVLGKYLKLHTRIQAEATAEVPLVRAAARWSARMK